MYDSSVDESVQQCIPKNVGQSKLGDKNPLPTNASKLRFTTEVDGLMAATEDMENQKSLITLESVTQALPYRAQLSS